MSLSMNRSRIKSLLAFVDRHVRRDGCDHSHRFTQQWARAETVDWDDLLDILEANGAFCDCEVVLNLPEAGDLQIPGTATPLGGSNPWLIPPGFESDPSAVFNKVIVCQAELGRNTYATVGEILIPAPKGATPRRRIRKSVSFFIGCQSGMPSEVGVVQECSQVSALDFARQVASSGIEELARFTLREAAFVLSRIASLQPSMPVATRFADRVGISSRHEELTVHRVIMR